MTLDLPFIFLVLMALSILAYVILDGFDLGVGILLPLAAHEQQNLMVASIGPFWDANETWLVLGVGILLVAFPFAHGIVLSSIYLEVALMLLALILRGVAFEFRLKALGWHRRIWNRLFFIGSFGAALAQGMMLAGVVSGFKSGPLFVLFELLVGIALAGGYALLGATWLLIKTEDDLHARALNWARYATLMAATGIAAISLVTPLVHGDILDKWFAWPQALWLAPLPVLSAAAAIGILVELRRLARGQTRREWLPFVLGVWLFVFAFAGLAYSLYPYLVVDRMTFREAAAAEGSLRFVFIGTVIVLPVIFGYTLFAYRVFWGKATDLRYGDD